MNSKKFAPIGYGLLLLGLIAAPLLGAYPVFVMKLLCFALFASAFNLLLGYTGLLSFGHAAFLGGAAAFLASADAQNGIIGKLFSFNVMMRSQATLYTADKAPKRWGESGAATDLAAALAWHDQSVCRALGEVKAFEQEKAPDYYGDVYSFLVRAGGSIMRGDNAGVMALVGTATE